MNIEGEKKGRGRPRKDVDPSGTTELFSDDNNISPLLSDSYDSIACSRKFSDNDGAGAVGEGDSEKVGELGGKGGEKEGEVAPEQSEEALLARFWAIGHDPKAPFSAQAQALFKYQQIKERIQGVQSGPDVPVELGAFIALVKADRVGSV